MKRILVLMLSFASMSLNAAVAPADPDSPLIECGILAEGPQGYCVYFHGFDSGTYNFPDLNYFSPGDTVFVVCQTIVHAPPNCPDAQGSLLWDLVGACDTLDFRCGSIGECGGDPGQCKCFRSATHGDLALFNVSTLTIGDSLRVVGRQVFGPGSWCTFDGYV
jgi:hypothetical protein